MSETDMTDDWMDPQPISASWSHVEPKPGDVEYLIERQRRIVCFGSPGYVTRWDYWARYDTAEERDAAFVRLRKEHPAWCLRSRDRRPWFERHGMIG